MRPHRVSSVILCSFLVAGTAAAQQGSSAIRGRVVDQADAVLPGVAITVTHAESGTVRETVSGPDGTYLVPGLIPGPYNVTAQLPGFSRLTREDLVVRVGTTLQVDLTLRVGARRREPHGARRSAAGGSHGGAGWRQRVDR